MKVAKFNKQDIPTILLSDEKSNVEGVTTISAKSHLQNKFTDLFPRRLSR